MSDHEDEKQQKPRPAPPVTKRERPDSIDDKDLQDSGELSALTTSVKQKMKNGCCRDCMKAFSKNGKVFFLIKIKFFRVAYVKYQDYKEDQLYHPQDANFVAAKAVILLISEEIKGKKLRKN